MKILVCIKQVPDTEANPLIRPDSLWIEEKNIAFRMNRYDEYAIEEALLIKDIFPETVIDVITAGPDRSAAVVKKGLEKGADNAVHIKTGDSVLTPFNIASLISDYARDKNYDIIFTGVMSEDLMQCMTGPMIASLLSLPCAVSVVKSEYHFQEKFIEVNCELEGGGVEAVKVTMPCLITVQTGVHQPRYPSLSNVMRARGISVIVINGVIDENRKSLKTMAYPEPGVKGTKIDGTTEEKADKLIDLLHEKGLL